MAKADSMGVYAGRSGDTPQISWGLQLFVGWKDSGVIPQDGARQNVGGHSSGPSIGKIHRYSTFFGSSLPHEKLQALCDMRPFHSSYVCTYVYSLW